MEEVRRLAEGFYRKNREIYEVGGHVRDVFLGRKSHDIDLTTNARPQEIINILTDLGYKNIYTIGAEYGTIGLLLEDGSKSEITTYRGEIYASDSRKPMVIFGDSLKQDLSRRDFTINAISRNPLNGEIFDPYNGVQDIYNMVVRCVGNDNLRFSEDPLRMMRAIRFGVQLNFCVACSFNRPSRLAIISLERIQEELNKIILSNNPALGIDMLCETRLMEYIVPEFLELKSIRQGKWHIKDTYEHSLMVLHKARNRSHGDNDLVFRLAAWLHDIGKPETMSTINGDITFHCHQDIGADKAQVILSRLRYSNDTVEKVVKLINNHMSVLLLKDTDMSKKVIRRFINKSTEELLWLLVDLAICDMKSTANERGEFIKELSETIINTRNGDKGIKLCSPIDGGDIMKVLNIQPGKTVGEIKKYLTELVIDGKLEPDDRSKALTLARCYYMGKKIEDNKSRINSS